MAQTNYPQKQGLYDPRNEHDACGVAMVARLDNRPVHDVIVRALTALDNLEPFTKLNDAAKALGDGGDPKVVYAPMFETFKDSWTADDVLTASGDNLHPSANGAKRIATVWFDTLEPVLKAWPAG